MYRLMLVLTAVVWALSASPNVVIASDTLVNVVDCNNSSISTEPDCDQSDLDDVAYHLNIEHNPLTYFECEHCFAAFVVTQHAQFVFIRAPPQIS